MGSQYVLVEFDIKRMHMCCSLVAISRKLQIPDLQFPWNCNQTANLGFAVYLQLQPNCNIICAYVPWNVNQIVKLGSICSFKINKNIISERVSKRYLYSVHDMSHLVPCLVHIYVTGAFIIVSFLIHMFVVCVNHMISFWPICLYVCCFLFGFMR